MIYKDLPKPWRPVFAIAKMPDGTSRYCFGYTMKQRSARCRVFAFGDQKLYLEGEEVTDWRFADEVFPRAGGAEK